MTSENSKSWLVGAGYPWRTLDSSNVRDDNKEGLFLMPTQPYQPPVFVVKACGSSSHKAGKEKAAWTSSSTVQCVWLTYNIDRKQREVIVEAGEGKDKKKLYGWGPRDETGRMVAPDDPRAWDPIDMAGDSNCTFILDQRYQTVYTHQYGHETLSILCQSGKPGSRWSRIAIDSAGWLMIFDDNEPDALLFDRQGQFRGTRSATNPSPPTPCLPLRYKIHYHQRLVTVEKIDGQETKQLFSWGPFDDKGVVVPASDPRAWFPIELAGDGNYTFLLDERYQTVYKHQHGQETPTILVRSGEPNSRWSRIAMDHASGWLIVFDQVTGKASLYDRQGEFRGTKKANWPTYPPASVHDSCDQPLPYFREGSWLSTTVDSSIYNCQWHRIRMAVKHLPPGTEVVVKTFAYQQQDVAPVRADDPRFVTAHTLVAPTQPSPADRSKKRTEEFLVQSGPGQFLSVAIQLRGDGFGTPIISALRVEFPRESYLEYLPPLYSAVEPMRGFLERFLAIFQTEWDEFDRRIEESEAFFDPQAVPEGVAMTYLASWLALDLEGTWNGQQNRQLLNAIPGITPRRGTVQALRDYVAVYLANIAGLTVEQVSQSQFPAIIEGFQERQYLMLSQAGSTLGTAQPLWSPGVVRRLQLGGFSRVGEVELVSTGDPERDLFHHFAHRFRVYVPAAWIRTAEHEQLLRRAIEAEMPAHVSYDLCLIDAGLRVGIQSTVGLDTIVGDPPSFKLLCEPEKQASSLPPRNQLGLGAVLSGNGKGPAVLDPGARVGGWILN